ncbi:MAG TPA: hypothetical protein VMY98_07775 [Anaerolineae bacterium]|nr:hypothetical protein [Anaerolineae bacterium]
MRYRLGDPYTAHAAPFPTIEEAVAIFVRDHGAKPQTIVLPTNLWTHEIRERWAAEGIEVEICSIPEGESLIMVGPVPPRNWQAPP